MGRGLPLNVLFVAPYAPSRIRTRAFHVIRALAAHGHRVTLATLWSDDEEFAAAAAAPSNGAAAVVAEHLTRARAAWNCARAILTPDPLQAHYSWHPALERRLRELVDTTPVDVVHVEHLRGVRYALALADHRAEKGARRPPIVWDSVDCISSLFRKAARDSRSPRVRLAAHMELRRTERYEGRVAGAFERVLVTSDADRADLIGLVPAQARAETARRFEVVPNGVDLEYFSPPDAPRDPAMLVISGKMSYHANATAVARFVEDVMPAVWRLRPDVRLVVVGKDPPREIRRLSEPASPAARGTSGRVTVTGTVADIRPYLRAASIAVAPIQYGVGIQNKVLEALACGTPVVATPQAVAALTVPGGDGVMVGQTADELAAAVVTLLGDADRRRRMGEAGRAYVERAHSWRAVAEQLSNIYGDAIY